MKHGTKIYVGAGESTVLADLDFETYSEAGFEWVEQSQKWTTPKGATKKGIFAVGAAAYAEHPSTEIISLAYNLKDGIGEHIWLPGCPLPQNLFDHIAKGALLEAWNDSFEYWIWLKVAHERMGWPMLNFWGLRDAAAKSRAFCLPGSLAKAGEALDIADAKMKEGKRLIQKFSIPRNPTKNNPALRTLLKDDPMDAGLFYKYNIVDIRAEAQISAQCPDVTGVDLEFYLCTRALNVRGMAVDVDTINAAAVILDQAYEKYNAELFTLTSGAVSRASEVQKMQKWLGEQGVTLTSLDAENTKAALKLDLPLHARRAIEIRQLVGSAGVKKVYALQRQATGDNRVHDMLIFNGARTGRDTGADIQPQNLVKQGVNLNLCPCHQYYGQHLSECPRCKVPANFAKKMGWTWQAVEQVSAAIKSRNLKFVEYMFDDALLAISGVIRGLFVAGEGKDLIASDYSAIEAVVAAVLAGEQWRIDAFEAKQDIYLVSASRITGIPLQEYLDYKTTSGENHSDRQKIGKPAELGLGFGGFLNGWRQFDDSDNFTDEEVKKNIMTWREASPMIVEMWGGQCRGKPWKPDYMELYGLEGMAIAAIQNPGRCFAHRDISYGVKDDILYCKLPSGRMIPYHQPRLSPSSRWEGQLEITFMGWNSNPKNGPMGWVRMNTFGGRFFENVCSAVANDILRFANVTLERNGYPIVLRVHDELVAEVDEGFGSIEEFEALMATLPEWAKGWPVRAAGGWRAKRYRKE